MFCAYNGEPVARYAYSEKNAVAMNRIGKGAVYSFGFAYGYSYAAKIAPHVPLSEKNNEAYPIPLMKNNILSDVLCKNGISAFSFKGRDIETAEFDNCTLIVNHSSHPIELDIEGEKVFQYKVNDKLLMPRSAVAVFK